MAPTPRCVFFAGRKRFDTTKEEEEFSRPSSDRLRNHNDWLTTLFCSCCCNNLYSLIYILVLMTRRTWSMVSGKRWEFPFTTHPVSVRHCLEICMVFVSRCVFFFETLHICIGVNRKEVGVPFLTVTRECCFVILEYAFVCFFFFFLSCCCCCCVLDA